MKLRAIKVGSSLRVGNTEKLYLECKEYDMELLDNLLTVVVAEKGKPETLVITSLANCAYAQPFDPMDFRQTSVKEVVTRGPGRPRTTTP